MFSEKSTENSLYLPADSDQDSVFKQFVASILCCGSLLEASIQDNFQLKDPWLELLRPDSPKDPGKLLGIPLQVLVNRVLDRKTCTF